MTVPAGRLEETPTDASSVQARYVNEDGDAILFSHADLFLIRNHLENLAKADAEIYISINCHYILIYL
jgi:hypothetical protein